MTTTTSRRLCKFDLRLFAIDNSASKNKSSCPRKGLRGRLAPRATVWIIPSELVHHETMRLVSLSLRLRRRIPRVFAFTGDIKRAHQLLQGDHSWSLSRDHGLFWQDCFGRDVESPSRLGIAHETRTLPGI